MAVRSGPARKIEHMVQNGQPAEAYETLLRKVAIFSGLSETETGFVLPRLVERRFQDAEIIFTEGDPCAGLYMVRAGHVRIFKSSPGGREQVLAIDGPGSSVAELPVFDGGNYPASGQAVGDTTLLFFSRQDFQALCLAHPAVALKVLKVIGTRLRKLVGIIEELSFTTVRERLIALLLRMGKSAATSNGDAVLLTLPANNSELAAQIGTVRELISRNLSRLQAEGFIEMDNRNLTIPSLKRLENELQNPS
ncbi:MAG TPA: Crp/Fnr family transcriptional regulator [Terriglobales bacterium]